MYPLSIDPKGKLETKKYKERRSIEKRKKKEYILPKWSLDFLKYEIKITQIVMDYYLQLGFQNKV